MAQAEGGLPSAYPGARRSSIQPHHFSRSHQSTHFFAQATSALRQTIAEFATATTSPAPAACASNVYFDNPCPMKDGTFETWQVFLGAVELWHRDAEHWRHAVTRKACALLSTGAALRDECEVREKNERVTFKIDSAAAIGILPLFAVVGC